MRKVSYLLVFLTCFCFPAALRSQEVPDRQQFARDIVVQPGETTGDLLCHYCSIEVRGTVNGDVVAIGGGIEVSGVVEGDAVALGGGIRLGPNATVRGEAVAVGGPIVRHAQASVGGEVESNAWFHVPGQRQLFLRGTVAFAVISVGLALLFGLALRARRMGIMAGLVGKRPFTALLVGVGVIVVVPLLYIVAEYLGRAETVFDVIVSVVVAVTVLAGYAGLNLWLGNRLARGAGSLAQVLGGAVVLAVMQLIPVVGVAVFLVVLLLAMGIATLSGYGAAENWLFQRLSRRRPAAPAPPNL